MTTQEIKLKIHEEADLFSEYDPDQTLLSEDIASCFERNYLNKHRSPAEKYVIHIYSDTPVNKESIQTRIIKYFKQEKDNIAYEIKKLTLKQIYLAVCGVLFLSIWFFLSVNSESAGAVKLEIISIVGWVAIWEAASISIMQRPELVFMRKAFERIINAQIIIDETSE